MGEIFAVIDRSGSMGNCVSDTIGGFNAFIKDQRVDGEDIKVTTVLFDDKYEVLHHAVLLSQVPQLTKKEYFVRGNTALLDAVGKTIGEASTRRGVSENSEDPYRVVFLVMTDGMENASHEFEPGTVKRMIEEKKLEGWEFFFLGANLDDFKDADRLGIDKSRQSSLSKSSVRDSYVAMSSNVREYMRTGKVSEDWDASFRKDEQKK